MKAAIWAEIRRLHEIEKLSGRAIARKLGCSRELVKRALQLVDPPTRSPRPARSKLDPFKSQIEAILARYPDLSAIRVMDKISHSVDGQPGYSGGLSLLRGYLRQVRPTRSRVYQDVNYSPGEALQIDWGDAGKLKIGKSIRRVSVFVAVLGYSRMCYIEFTLSQRKSEFYRSLVNSLEFFVGSPRKVIFDNLKAAVLSGSGRNAVLHPEFAALCGHYLMEPVACEARDPESKGRVEASVRYVKHNALAGRDDELTCFQAYNDLANSWRDDVANRRIHDRLKERPIERFEQEKRALRPLPKLRFDTDEVILTSVRSTAQVIFETNRYSVPPQLAGKTVLIRADKQHVAIHHQAEQVAEHVRCYSQRETIIVKEHLAEAIAMRKIQRSRDIHRNFIALGEVAQCFYMGLCKRPVKPAVHLRKLADLLALYGSQSVLSAIEVANQYQTFDAAYVETILYQQRRKQSLPSPTTIKPQRTDLTEIQLDPPDPAKYDRFIEEDDVDSQA
jgi:transposase